MKVWHVVAAGGLGFLLGLQLRGTEQGCCARVAGAVRDKVPGWAQGLGDALNIWGIAPGLLDVFGVKS